jgi:serine/threonine protein kinase
MGEVYRARDTDLKRDVAIKVLPPGVSRDPERLARFKREAEIRAALNHPHIAQVYGLTGTPDGAPAMVMELVDGETLAEMIGRGPIDRPHAVDMAVQIAEGSRPRTRPGSCTAT